MDERGGAGVLTNKSTVPVGQATYLVLAQNVFFFFVETSGMEANREGGSEVTRDHRRTWRREM